MLLLATLFYIQLAFIIFPLETILVCDESNENHNVVNTYEQNLLLFFSMNVI